jgi:hypothetical protein
MNDAHYQQHYRFHNVKNPNKFLKHDLHYYEKKVDDDVDIDDISDDESFDVDNDCADNYWLDDDCVDDDCVDDDCVDDDHKINGKRVHGYFVDHGALEEYRLKCLDALEK